MSRGNGKRGRTVKGGNSNQLIGLGVAAVIIIAAFVFMTGGEPEGLAKARALIVKAEARLADSEPAGDETRNDDLLHDLHDLKEELSAVPGHLETESRKARDLIDEVREAIEEIEAENAGMKKLAEAEAGFADVQQKLESGALDPAAGIAELRLICSRFAGTEPAASAEQKIKMLEQELRLSEEAEVSEARLEAGRLAGDKQFKKALQVLQVCRAKTFSYLEAADLNPLDETSTDIRKQARKYFEQSVRGIVERARTGDCRALVREAEEVYAKSGLEEFKPMLDAALADIQTIRNERLAAARAAVKKELDSVAGLMTKRAYEEARKKCEEIESRVTEPELKSEIRSLARRAGLMSAAKLVIIQLIERSEGINVEGVGFIEKADAAAITLKIDAVTMPLSWDKLRDAEFMGLVRKSLGPEASAEALTAYAVMLIKSDKAEEADQYLQKALQADAEIAKRYPDIFEETRKRMAQKKAEEAAAMALAAKGGGKADYGVGVQTSMIKVFGDEAYTGPMGLVGKMALARNEYESIQVVLVNARKDLEAVKVTATGLKSKSGAVIGRKHVTVNPVGYVNTDVKCNPRPYKAGKIGWWPDPLLPDKAYPVKQGRNQPYWITVYAPPNTPAGEYRGRVMIQPANSGARIVELSVEVFNFEIPVKGHIKTLAWMGEGRVHFGLQGGAFTRERLDLVKKFTAFACARRMAPGGSLAHCWNWGRVTEPVSGGNGKYNYEYADELIQYGIDHGMQAFFISFFPNLRREGMGQLSEKWKAGYRDAVTNYAKHLKAKGWADMAYIYNYDEAPKSAWEDCKKNYTFARQVTPDIKVIQTLNQVGGFKVLENHAEAFNTYIRQYDKTICKDLQKRGKEIWWALCVYPYERPNIDFIEYPGIDGRLVGWLSWLYKVDAFEYWGMTGWGGNSGTIDWIGGSTFTKWGKCNQWPPGGGLMLYPDLEPGPLSCIRLENHRDGMEDLEYLAIFTELSGNRKAAEEICRIVARSAESWTDEPGQVYLARVKLARAIERMWKRTR